MKVTSINILNSWLCVWTISFLGVGGRSHCNLFDGAQIVGLPMPFPSPGNLRWKLKLLRSEGSDTFSEWREDSLDSSLPPVLLLGLPGLDLLILRGHVDH